LSDLNKNKNFLFSITGKIQIHFAGHISEAGDKKKWKLVSPFCVSNTEKAGFEKA